MSNPSFVTDLIGNLRSLGLQSGDPVIVHTSFKSMGLADAKPSDLIEALVEVLLPDGAVLFPNLNIPHEFTTENPPHWDVAHGRVAETIGIVPQTFKERFAELYSIHPTHSLMGLGDKASSILDGHEKTGYCCGPGTPWEKNALYHGKVLLIGVDQRKNTTYHCAEERLPKSYQLTENPITGAVVVDGRAVSVASRLHVWQHHPDFNKINSELEERDFLIRGMVGSAPTLCLYAHGFLQVCREKMDKNPRFFL